MDEDVGQGKLYSPAHAIQVVKKRSSHKGDDEQEEEESNGRGIRRNVGVIKDRLLEKLSAAAVPTDALENARHFLETVVRDVRVAAHGLTMDALTRIKSHLSDFLPSLSPALAKKMVEDAEKEAAKQEEGDDEQQNKGQQQQGGSGNNKSASFMSPASSLFASLVKPLSRL
ncbi:hypothetical protein AAG906_030692 [Vitis piasezkii]